MGGYFGVGSVQGEGVCAIMNIWVLIIVPILAMLVLFSLGFLLGRLWTLDYAERKVAWSRGEVDSAQAVIRSLCAQKSALEQVCREQERLIQEKKT